MSLSINRSALVMYSSEQMFALVNDIPSYPQFLPWCSKASIIENKQNYMLASMEVSKGRVRQVFTTRNDLSIENRIEIDLVEGPFNYLKGAWEFTYLNDDACKVELSLDFEIKHGIARMAFGTIFNQATTSMVDAFCTRAKQVYG